MSSKPFAQPLQPLKGIKNNPAPSSPPSSRHSVQTPKNPKHSSSTTSVPIRQPATSVKAAAGQPFSSSTERITNLNPNTKCPCQMTKSLLARTQNLPGATTTTTSSSSSSRRGRPLSSMGNGAPPPPDREPYDEEIRDILKEHPNREGVNGHLNILRATIMNLAAISYNPVTEVFSDKSDPYVKQLVRVLDELKTTGECRVGEQIIRP